MECPFSQRTRRETANTAGGRSYASWLALVAVCLTTLAAGAPAASSDQFRKTIQPILVEYCYDCHGDGMNKGQVAFDGFKSHDEFAI
jgi:hypothetical protein